MTRLLNFALLLALCLLTGCASGPKFTVDDGRQVDETMLAGMRAYGAGERLLRPAIARSAEQTLVCRSPHRSSAISKTAP